MSAHVRPVVHAAGCQLTADREECVRLLALDCGHAFQSAEPSPADVDPALHLRLPKHGAKQSNGDDVVLFLGGIHLLGTPEGKRLHTVDKRLKGSPSNSSIVPKPGQSECFPQVSERYSFL